MKILMINTIEFNRNGMSSVILNLTVNLVKLGHQVDIIFQDSIEDDYLNDLNKIGCSTFNIRNRSKFPLSYIHSLRKIIYKNNYDIVHIHGNSATTILELLAIKKFKGLKVLHAHGQTTNHPIVHRLFIVYR